MRFQEIFIISKYSITHRYDFFVIRIRIFEWKEKRRYSIILRPRQMGPLGQPCASGSPVHWSVFLKIFWDPSCWLGPAGAYSAIAAGCHRCSPVPGHCSPQGWPDTPRNSRTHVYASSLPGPVAGSWFQESDQRTDSFHWLVWYFFCGILWNRPPVGADSLMLSDCHSSQTQSSG